MKALSLTQPWAWLVVHAGKNVENRKWNTGFRGTFLIHASKKMACGDYFGAKDMQRLAAGIVTIPDSNELAFGGIVGRADLVHVYYPLENRGPWSMAGQFGFVLENMRPVPFVPCRGMLNFWDVPADVLAELERQERP